MRWNKIGEMNSKWYYKGEKLLWGINKVILRYDEIQVRI